MSGCLTDPLKAVAKMLAEREDGSLVPVVFLAFEGESLDEAEAFEVEKGGRLIPLGWRLATWRKVFEVFAPDGAEGG